MNAATECHFVPYADGKVYCPVCDPEGRKLLPLGVRRNCQTPEAKSLLAEMLAKSDDENRYLFPGPYLRYREIDIVNNGAGSELKAIFTSFHIYPDGDCNCEAIANEMDQRGPDWCEENVESLIDQIEAESKKRRWAKYIFSRIVARRMIRLAIKRARRKEQKKDTTI